MALNPVTGTHRQYVPQNERDIQETRVHSVVHDIAINCQDAIEKAIRFMRRSGPSGTTATVEADSQHRVFQHQGPPSRSVKELVNIYEKKGLTRESLLREVYKRNLLGDEFNIQNEVAALAAIDAALQAAEQKPAGNCRSPTG